MTYSVHSTQGSFGTLGISATGMGAYKLWIDAVADNIANIDTIRPTNQSAFQERFVQVSSGAPDGGRGVHIQGAAFGSAEGLLEYAPNNPLADADGMVRKPDISLSDQMTYLIEAQRGYQANVAVMDRARAAYESALTIGQQ
jgi:flagellar basal-body rod protein FlgC